MTFRLQTQRSEFIQPISKILHAFNQNKYTLGIFIYLSKGSDTVDHDILLKKIDMHCIKGKNSKS